LIEFRGEYTIAGTLDETAGSREPRTLALPDTEGVLNLEVCPWDGKAGKPTT
jgi:hypothetical protein